MTASARVFHEMKKLEGLKEIKGAEHEPLIIEMFATVGHQWVKDDETAWCAACMGYVLSKTGMRHTSKLNARSYLDLPGAVEIEDAQPGDIVIFSRGDPNGWQGHVTIFLRRSSGGQIVCLGGNQGDMVKESTYSADRLLGIRRPQPVRKSVNQTGTVKGAATAGAGAVIAAGIEVVSTVNEMTAPAQDVASDPAVSPALKLMIGAAILGLIGFGLFRVWSERNKKFKAGDV